MPDTLIVHKRNSINLKRYQKRYLKENFMLKKILSTENSYSALVTSLTLGLVMFLHGAQKMLGWFGGYGFSGTMGFFTEKNEPSRGLCGFSDHC